MEEVIKLILREINEMKELIGDDLNEYIETDGGQLSINLGAETKTDKSTNVRNVSKR